MRCARDGTAFTRWIGVNARSTEQEAIDVAIVHVNTPRTVAAGYGAKIVDIDICHMWEAKAMALIEGADDRHAQEVNRWRNYKSCLVTA